MLMLHIPRVEARREMQNRMGSPFSKMTAERVFTLVLAATDNEDLADKSRADWMLSEMVAGREPEV